MLLRTSLLVLCAAPAAAQLVLYDAGTAGNPPTAPSPDTQGWSISIGNGVTVAPISPDGATGLNAWEVSDTNPAYGAPGLHDYGLSWQEINAAYARGFELTAVLRLTAGSPSSIYIAFSDGFTLSDDLFLVAFSIAGADVVARDWHSSSSWICAGAMDGQYHTFGMRYTAGSASGVQFVYEGEVMGPLAGGIPPPPVSNQGVSWGSWTTGVGRARFHRVEFRYLDDLGTSHCGPAVANSTGAPAQLSALGSPVVANQFLEVTAASLPANQFGYLLASLSAGFVANPGGSQGNLCLAGNIGRFVAQVQSSGAGGSFTVPVDLGAIPTTPVAAIAPGETWNFQCWYRDQNPGSTSNFTDALRIEFR
jgi:hypothetical protein